MNMLHFSCRQHLTNLIEWMSVDKQDHSGFCFYSSFFPPEPAEPFISMRSLRRTRHVNALHVKCMVRPERVQEMGQDDVIKKARELTQENGGGDSGGKTLEVPENMALLHHYRDCDPMIQSNCTDLRYDDAILKYKDRLHSRHMNVFLHLMTSINELL